MTFSRFFERITFIILFTGFFTISCSQSSPEIRYGNLELIYYENGGNYVERLSFFILPHDNDGFDDLEELWLYHDWEGLSWQMNSKNWIQETIEGNTWIGSRSISMTDRSFLPRGLFRAVLIDKGGNRSERQFSYDTPPDWEETFPSLSISGDRYRIESQFPQQRLLVYDNEGNYLLTVQTQSLEGSLSDLGLPSQAESIALWTRNPARSVSAFTDIVPLRL